MNLNQHCLSIVEDCLRALANCREATAHTTLISPHMLKMSREEVSNYTKHNLVRNLAALLVNDAEISESVVWADGPGREGNETDTRFTARTVVMKASTYRDLCQALRHLQQEALDDKYTVMP